MLVGKTVLNLTIIVNLSFLSIYKQNLTRLQTSLLGNLCRVEVHNTNLRGDNHRVVLGDGVTGRTQTITVEHTTGKASVGEQQCGRSVPWLHQNRMILIERL